METDQQRVADRHPTEGKMETKNEECIFCNLGAFNIIQENKSFYAMYDQFPVTQFHTLIIPKRHVRDYFHLDQHEIAVLNELLHSLKSRIQTQDPSVTGFNIGMNCGEDAGQTVMHCHTHLMPRRKGDIKNPRGGVRGVIPNKQSY